MNMAWWTIRRFLRLPLNKRERAQLESDCVAYIKDLLWLRVRMQGRWAATIPDAIAAEALADFRRDVPKPRNAHHLVAYLRERGDHYTAGLYSEPIAEAEA